MNEESSSELWTKVSATGELESGDEEEDDNDLDWDEDD